MTDETALTTVEQSLTTEGYVDHHKKLLLFIKSQLKETATGENGDYGVIPYTKKKSLLKPGAEKLCRRFGFIPQLEILHQVEDFEKGFVFYKYRCTLIEFRSGKKVGEAIRSCNNKENKHAKKSVYEATNTIDAVAQKRAVVAATVQALAASEIFDADAGEYDEKAPNRPVTEAEDPHRISVLNRLYGVATEHGWTNAWIHAAVKKKWQIESLTALTNEQIEELTEFITITYTPVAKGTKPKLREDTVAEEKPVDSTDDTKNKPVATAPPAEKQSVVRLCPNPSGNADCQNIIPDDYPKDVCSSCRMKDFIKTGKIRKGLPLN